MTNQFGVSVDETPQGSEFRTFSTVRPLTRLKGRSWCLLGRKDFLYFAVDPSMLARESVVNGNTYTLKVKEREEKIGNNGKFSIAP